MILTGPAGNIGAPLKGAAPGTGDCWILHERARRYHWSGAGQLSLKCFFGGGALYQLGKGYHAVDDASYLVLNAAQNYSIHIEANAPVESFCIFFGAGFAEEVHGSVNFKPERLLDAPWQGSEPVRFFEKTYPHDSLVSPAVSRLRRLYPQHAGESGWLEEEFHGVMQRLLRARELTRREAQTLDSVRPATREELYRRVCRARDYAAAMFAGPVTLAQLSAVACLSPNHLLRTFRQAFGQTPHQYLVARRLGRARELLATTETSVTDICLEVGFESLGSFSHLFRKRFGIAPSQFRERTRP